MIWHRADRSSLVPLAAFLERYEHLNISLSSRISAPQKLGGGRKLILPSTSEATLYLGYPNHYSESPNRVRYPVAAILLTKNGSIFPLLSPDYPFRGEEIGSLLSRILPAVRNLFSILGTERDVDLCRPYLDRPMDTTLSYYLMVRNRDLPVPESAVPQPLQVHKLDLKNYKRVYPLEEMYQHEEVLVHPQRFNRTAHLLHFKRVATRQYVVFAEGPNGPIAKAGTNSIGLACCQVGGVYTLPQYRRMGVSRALMLQLLRWSSIEGYSTALFVQKRNTPAVELYKSLSFDVHTDYRIIYM